MSPRGFAQSACLCSNVADVCTPRGGTRPSPALVERAMAPLDDREYMHPQDTCMCARCRRRRAREHSGKPRNRARNSAATWNLLDKAGLLHRGSEKPEPERQPPLPAPPPSQARLSPGSTASEIRRVEQDNGRSGCLAGCFGLLAKVAFIGVVLVGVGIWRGEVDPSFDAIVEYVGLSELAAGIDLPDGFGIGLAESTAAPTATVTNTPTPTPKATRVATQVWTPWEMGMPTATPAPVWTPWKLGVPTAPPTTRIPTATPTTGELRAIYEGSRNTQTVRPLCTGSMEPTITCGMTVDVTRGVPAGTIEVDDIIVYHVPRGCTETVTLPGYLPVTHSLPFGLLVIHRVVNVLDKQGDIFYRAKGDANMLEDPCDIPHGAVYGVVFEWAP